MTGEPFPTPLNAKTVYDQPYLDGPVGHPLQNLDVYLPEGSGRFPLVIWIHGGGWFSGDKAVEFAPLFLREGFALASVNYRLTTGGFPFPAQIEDCLAALAWLRQHGDGLGIDVEKVGLFGHSAGAHLATLLATICITRHFGANGCANVQAVAGWAGPYDLGRERGKWPESYFIWDAHDPFCTHFSGSGTYDEEFARSASPASYLRQRLPPMLLVHGKRDDIVPHEQAGAYVDGVREMGGDVIYRLDPDGSHDLRTPENLREAVGFFKRILG